MNETWMGYAKAVAWLLAIALGLWLCRNCSTTAFHQTQPLP